MLSEPVHSASNWTGDSYAASTHSNSAGVTPDDLFATGEPPTQVHVNPTQQIPAAEAPVTTPTDADISQNSSENTEPPAPNKVRHPSSIHAHRRLVGLVLLAAIGLIYFALHAQSIVPNPTTTATSPAVAALGNGTSSFPGTPPNTPATAQINTELAQAAAWYSAHNTYTGWPTPASAQVAQGPDQLAIAQTISGVCYYGTLSPGSPPKVVTDATGSYCAPGAAAMAQQAMNITASVQTATADQALYQAATTAQQLAQRQGSAQSPSFTGLPALGVSGVTVVSSSSTSLILQTALASGGCQVVTVPVSGAVPPPTTQACQP